MIDRVYEKARNALIPGAETRTNDICGVAPGQKMSKKDCEKWTRVFSKEMDRAAYAAGLISWNPDKLRVSQWRAEYD